MTEPTDPHFPDAQLYGVIGALPRSFGGVVAATLARLSDIAEIEHRDITLLTKSLSVDPVQRERELHEEGRLSPRVRVKNIWHDLQSMADDELESWANATGRVVPDADRVRRTDLPYFTGELEIPRNSGEDPRDRVVRFRPDGTLAFLDEGAAEAPEGWARRITVFLRDGRQLDPWHAATPLYHAWFDHLFGERESVLFNDSSQFGNVVSRYRRDNVLTVQVIHSNYLDRLRHGPLAPERFHTLSRLDWFDLVAALTPGQVDDLVASGLVHRSRIVAIPNASRPSVPTTPARRDPRRGIHVARLATEKRSSHTIRAIQRAHTPATPVELDIYGDGPPRKDLETLTNDLGASSYVRFHGHDPRARQEFAEASFSVLSSTSEGQSLVLLESMAAGCIPIAYDIKYGPSMMIDDGVDGFLVAPGDVHMLADRILRVSALDESQLDRMRRAGIEKAQAFAPEHVVAQWGATLDAALATKQNAPLVEDRTLTAELLDISLNSSAARLSLAVAADVPISEDSPPRLTWLSRTHEALGSLTADTTRLDGEGRTVVDVTVPFAELDEQRDGTCDVYVDVASNRSIARTRVKSPALEAPARARTVRFYRTAHGNLSMALHAPRTGAS